MLKKICCAALLLAGVLPAAAEDEMTGTLKHASPNRAPEKIR